LANEQLLSLCRVYGDSFGTLKFFVSVPSALVYHEYSPSAQPLEHVSFPSQSDKLPLKVGYEAALEDPDRESNKSTPCQQPQDPPSVISPNTEVFQSQRHTTIDRRPSSPRLGLSEQGPPPPQPLMPWSQRKDDKYGCAIRPPSYRAYPTTRTTSTASQSPIFPCARRRVYWLVSSPSTTSFVLQFCRSSFGYLGQVFGCSIIRQVEGRAFAG